jgi:hypothetical protein
MRWDLYHARNAEETEIERITPYRGSRSKRSKEGV